MCVGIALRHRFYTFVSPESFGSNIGLSMKAIISQTATFEASPSI